MLRARAPTPIATRTFSQSLAKRGGGHGHQYDAPSGWLFGVKPGEEYKKEGWETATFYVFIPLMVVFVGVYAFKPDTRYVLSAELTVRRFNGVEMRSLRMDGGGRLGWIGRGGEWKILKDIG